MKIFSAAISLSVTSETVTSEVWRLCRGWPCVKMFSPLYIQYSTSNINLLAIDVYQNTYNYTQGVSWQTSLWLQLLPITMYGN